MVQCWKLHNCRGSKKKLPMFWWERERAIGIISLFREPLWSDFMPNTARACEIAGHSQRSWLPCWEVGFRLLPAALHLHLSVEAPSCSTSPCIILDWFTVKIVENASFFVLYAVSVQTHCKVSLWLLHNTNAFKYSCC